LSIKGGLHKRGAKIALGIATTFLIVVCARQALGVSQNAMDFPQGYDGVTAAPGSHRIIFENALVRVLEVTMPPPGTTEPKHHHHWPSVFLDWDKGGKSPHIRYHQPGDVVRDIPSIDTPPHPGHWLVHRMKPEPMHSIETVENYYYPNDPPSVRVELNSIPEFLDSVFSAMDWGQCESNDCGTLAFQRPTRGDYEAHMDNYRRQGRCA
jgi:hypothetical protein